MEGGGWAFGDKGEKLFQKCPATPAKVGGCLFKGRTMRMKMRMIKTMTVGALLPVTQQLLAFHPPYISLRGCK